MHQPIGDEERVLGGAAAGEVGGCGGDDGGRAWNGTFYWSLLLLVAMERTLTTRTFTASNGLSGGHKQNVSI